MWSENEEGYAVLAARAWTSALLAAQGREGDVAAREADY